MAEPPRWGGRVPVLDTFRLDGRAALVTGAASGIGLAFGEALAEAGAAVALVDVDGPGAARAADRLEAVGGRCGAWEADVADEASLEAAFEAAEQALGPIDIVFANAGIAGDGGEVADVGLEGWRRVLEVDLTGTLLTVRAAARRMVPRGYGKIVTTGSMYSLRGDPLFGSHAYTAAKSGVVGLTRSAAIGLGRHGVRVNAILPGYIRTQLAGGALYAADPDAEALRAKVVARLPLGRIGEPAELKGLALFLASPASDYCTGGAYPVDGGWLST